MKVLQGAQAAAGIGKGIAFIVESEVFESIPKYTINKDDTQSGWKQLEAAIAQTMQYIANSRDSANKEQAQIFDTYALMLSDTEFLSTVKKEYEKTLINIEHVLHTQVTDLAAKLRISGDEYLQERAEDIVDIYGRVLNILLERKQFNIDEIPLDSIIVAVSLRPSDTVIFTKRKPAAIVLQEGGAASHFAILARSYGIPAVFGIKDILHNIPNKSFLIVDANKGAVFVEPDLKTKTDYEQKTQHQEKRAEELTRFRTKKAQTKDGVQIAIYANIGSLEEAELAQKEGADGIGLFRTEFMFMDSNRLLSENEQYSIYKNVLDTMQEKPVVIRTLDSGGDKIIVGTQSETQEKNPLMGFRAIRFCLEHTAIFKTQLRALLRAGKNNNLRIMFPLITGYDQLLQALNVVEEAKRELKNQHVEFNETAPIGIMIEMPSAALCAQSLATKSAFFSIGTNDLTQYTLGIDRENTKVAHLYNEFHPAVLSLIAQTVDAAKKNGISLSVCGEFASKESGAMILIGLGVRSLSMNANKISSIKETLTKFTLLELEELAKKVLACLSEAEIQQILHQLI